MAIRSIPIGTTFGRLTVVGEAEPIVDKSGRNHSGSIVRCECGTERTVRNSRLRSGETASCGCLRAEKSVELGRSCATHQLSKSAEHNTWISMTYRCRNENHVSFKNYGGRGITVCDRWLNSFEAFLEDMGPRPSSEHSIDRIDNDGNYEPGNCRWATVMEQGRNKRNSRLFTFYGKTMTLLQWCQISQVHHNTVGERLKRGWSEKKAFWTPVRVRHRTMDS